jgi:GR25 family glycosyltransferase involved in LPS biosynthesis
MKCNKKNKKIFIVFVIILILLICLVHYYFNYYKQWLIIENFESREESIKAFYINLDKNTIRRNDFLESYYNSDMNEVMLTRFPAILGKTVDVNVWLRPEAIIELNEIEKTFQRTHHYQLTYGGVGCFLSHYTLAKQLLNDSRAKYYIIFEDDISFYKNTLNPINYYLSNAPENWDIIHFTNLRKVNYSTHVQFYKPNGFWGMQAYIINKKGAQKLVDEVQREKIDGQIDAYLSRMVQQDKINIYITDRRLIYHNSHSSMSDIQYRLNRDSSYVNPYNYKGYFV